MRSVPCSVGRGGGGSGLFNEDRVWGKKKEKQSSSPHPKAGIQNSTRCQWWPLLSAGYQGSWMTGPEVPEQVVSKGELSPARQSCDTGTRGSPGFLLHLYL